MDCFAGLDVSVKDTSVCIVDQPTCGSTRGRGCCAIVRERY
jgi:hypothetical protein